MANRKYRQAFRRMRGKVTNLERRCDRLIYELERAAGELDLAFYRKAELEAQVTALLDPIVKAKMLESAPPILLTCECRRNGR